MFFNFSEVQGTSLCIDIFGVLILDFCCLARDSKLIVYTMYFVIDVVNCMQFAFLSLESALCLMYQLHLLRKHLTTSILHYIPKQ